MKERHFPSKAPDDLFEDGLLTVQEAADFLGISRSGLYNLMMRGHVLYVMVGSIRRVPKKALLALLKSGIRGGWAAN